MKYKLLSLYMLAFTLSANTASAADLCTESDTYVKITDNQNVVKLCNTEYVSYFNKQLKIPVATFESLSSYEANNHAPRTNNFRADYRAGWYSAQPKDYTRTGYDRGHMAASSNSSELSTVSESFLMTNIVPQNHSMNTGRWKALEDYSKKLAAKYNELKIITYAEADCRKPETIKNGVAIPKTMGKYLFNGIIKEHYSMPNVTPLYRNLMKYRVSGDSGVVLCGATVSAK